MGLDLKKKVRLKLNFSGDVTTSVDRPIYERVKDGDTFKNAYFLDPDDDVNLIGILKEFVNIDNPNQNTKSAGKELFSRFYFS